MKITGWLIPFGMLFLQACSAVSFLYTPTPRPTSTPSPTATASQTPTSTITLTPSITPTPRNTVTQIAGFETLTPALITTPATATAMYVSEMSTDAPGDGFESVSLTHNQIFWGTCERYYTKMKLVIDRSLEVYRVYLFLRLESAKKPGETTPWFGTVMDYDGDGAFLYTLRANQIPERGNFLKAWVHFQFVAEDEEKEIVARSRIYTTSLTLGPCP